MAKQLGRGSKVLIRTAGGFIRSRRLWNWNAVAVIAASDQAYALLEQGVIPLEAGAVAVPIEDVFIFDAKAPIDQRPRDGFQAYTPVTDILNCLKE